MRKEFGYKWYGRYNKILEQNDTQYFVKII